ncbi:MAG TPA: peptidase M13, partial [Paraprevotella xylaniphila]|nr:peptidase M13 [Paraprevotella xylaniphila]
MNDMMNLKQFIPMMAFASLALAGCGGPTSKTGIDLANLDQTAKPGDNFYQYACGGWIKAHPLTGEYSTYGNFEVLIENNNKQLRGLIEAMAKGQHEVGTLEQKIGDLYNIAMDSVKQNKDGYAPIKEDMDAIAAIQDRKEIIAQMAKLGRKGLPGYFGFYIDADIKNSSMNLLQIMQGGLSLGEKEYYLDNDSATVHIRESFKAYMEKMFTLCGSTPEEAKRKMEAVMGIETRIAVPSYSAVQQRDPEANYHKMTYEELKKDYSGIDWDVFFTTMGIQGLKEVSVGQPEPIHEVEKILAETPVEDQKAFMEWKLINSSASYLSDELRACRFDFYGRVMSGKQQDRPRWKKAVATVEGVLGEGLGEKYVEKYFPAAAKERMVKLVKNLQDALAERIKVQDWMSDETKKVALDKLASFYVKVGYPDKWRDYSGLEIKDDSYWANIVRSNEFDLAYIIDKKLNKPVDRDEWYMTPQTVNAYYNPTTNEICFP